MLRFDVRDTGVGVPPAKRQEIFQEFVQADASHTRKFGGTGLGLAISKRLVEMMGGEIGVDTALPMFGEPGGSCFWFTLPALGIAPAEGDRPLAGMRVAVMSKNKALREGLYLQIAASGGIPVNPKGPADAILIDAGTGTVPELTVHPDPAIPALVLLTPAARGSLEEMRALGFAGYLVKPVRQSSLVTQLILCRNSRPLVTAMEAFVEAARPQADVPPDHSVVRKAGGASGLHILLAEDNPINMMLIRELLRRRGHRITEVTTGNAAVQALRENRYDLLLTDIHMPGMDGVEAVRAIRAGEARSGRARTPIVALTADAREGGKRVWQEAGMDGFLIKPLNPAELEEMFLMLFPSAEPSHIVAA
jgi:CheY-like chemotaxis protein